jgi:uncharacterized membrane-anchored protein
MFALSRRFGAGALIVIAFLSLSLAAQEGEVSSPREQQPVIDWQDGPTTGNLEGIAEIQVPEGFRFTGKNGTQKLLELTHNPINGDEVGAIIPITEKDDEFYFIIFEFSEVGYVKDDEKDKIDADALLESIKEGTEQANQYRKEKGWGALHIMGWYTKPFYNPETNNLAWAILGNSGGGGEVVNYSTRILGRRGTMNVDLVMDSSQYHTILPAYNNVLTGFTYRSGNKYSEFVSGDKVAAYGLTALIAGGAGAAAAKMGFFGKIWKFLIVFAAKGWKLMVIAVIAIAAFLRKLFSGKVGESEVPPLPPDDKANTATA